MSNSILLATLSSLKERRAATWAQAKVYLENRDSHGIMDMGAEIQALDRAIREIEFVVSESQPRRSLFYRILWWIGGGDPSEISS